MDLNSLKKVTKTKIENEKESKLTKGTLVVEQKETTCVIPVIKLSRTDLCYKFNEEAYKSNMPTSRLMNKILSERYGIDIINIEKRKWQRPENPDKEKWNFLYQMRINRTLYNAYKQEMAEKRWGYTTLMDDILSSRYD